MSSDIRGRVCDDYAIAKHNTWRIGGQVKRVFWPADLADLQTFLAQVSNDEKVLWLGLGSNVLFPDERLDCTVIMTHKGLQSIQALENNRFVVEVGVSCAKLAKKATQLGNVYAGFFAGIPGTVGGALRMNAGAFGGETWRYVRSVDVIDRKGCIHTLPASAFSVGYRQVVMPTDHWFVRAEFDFTNTDRQAVPLSIADLLKKRGDSQPIGSFNCGSVFKNPAGDYAAALIERCGLKGKQIGGAFVSPKHANFIINNGEATAHDVMCLMTHIMTEVKLHCGVQLEPEVRIIQNEV